MKYTVHKQYKFSNITEETRTTITADNDDDLKSIVENIYNTKIIEINHVFNTVTIEA